MFWLFSFYCLKIWFLPSQTPIECICIVNVWQLHESVHCRYWSMIKVLMYTNATQYHNKQVACWTFVVMQNIGLLANFHEPWLPREKSQKVPCGGCHQLWRPPAFRSAWSSIGLKYSPGTTPAEIQSVLSITQSNITRHCTTTQQWSIWDMN